MAEGSREPIGALKYILNIFVDKKQVPILDSHLKVMMEDEYLAFTQGAAATTVNMETQ